MSITNQFRVNTVTFKADGTQRTMNYIIFRIFQILLLVLSQSPEPWHLA